MNPFIKSRLGSLSGDSQCTQKGNVVMCSAQLTTPSGDVAFGQTLPGDSPVDCTMPDGSAGSRIGRSYCHGKPGTPFAGKSEVEARAIMKYGQDDTNGFMDFYQNQHTPQEAREAIIEITEEPSVQAPSYPAQAMPEDRKASGHDAVKKTRASSAPTSRVPLYALSALAIAGLAFAFTRKPKRRKRR